MEREPEKNPSGLASVLKMLEVAREEQAMPIRRPKRIPDRRRKAAPAPQS